MLKASSLSCRRGRRLVFAQLGLDLAAGDLLLVTGANGSGKSSLLRILAGLLEPAEGELFWQGEKINDPAAHRARLSYIGHLDALKPELTVDETLSYWNLLGGGKGAKNLPTQFGLGGLAATPVRRLSAGQKRRLSLARLAQKDAPLWLLDEPATALDILGQKLLADLLAQHRAKGGVAVVAAHQGENLPGARRLTLGEGA